MVGSPRSMRPLAEAFSAAGFTVELPLLPGHGTSPDELAATTYARGLAIAHRNSLEASVTALLGQVASTESTLASTNNTASLQAVGILQPQRCDY